MENLYDIFQRHFPADRSLPFIETEGGHVHTYADLEQACGRFCRLLATIGIGKGDRLAVQVEKSPQAIFLYLACLRSGVVFLPLDTAYQGEELEYFFSDAEPAAVVCDSRVEKKIRERAAQCGLSNVLTLNGNGGGTLTERSRDLDPKHPVTIVDGNDIAALLYTSGTTGRCKGAMLTHRNLSSNAKALHKAWGWVPDDVLLHALPIFHTHGLFVATHCALLNGGKMLFLSRFDSKTVIGLLPRATVFMGVPTYYTRLLADPGFDADVCRGIRLFISGSAPLTKETFEVFKERTGHTIIERYGMTETGMNTSNPLTGEPIAGSVGIPLPGVEVRVTGGGGILEVRGPNVFKGYWRAPGKTEEAFRDDGFFITGDLARIDGRGYVHIVGRASDMIISGGLNVYPKEIETVIDEMDGVVESAVIGIPHVDLGEAVTAIVVPLAGRDRVSEEAVIAAVNNRLANYKIPKAVNFVDALPRNAMGKVQKNILKKSYGVSS